jgi:Skp family chaperone for outer membrane proteins
MRRTRHLLGLTICVALGAARLPLVAKAQESPAQGPISLGQTVVPHAIVVTLDRERFYAESKLGRSFQDRFDRASADLIAENRKLETALEAEERQLTERRKIMSPEEFGKIAAEFDSRVEQLRKAQDAKSRALTRSRETDRQAFFQQAVPVLGALMREIGAAAIIDRASIILIFDDLDITTLAIERLDAATAAVKNETGAPVAAPQTPGTQP